MSDTYVSSCENPGREWAMLQEAGENLESFRFSSIAMSFLQSKVAQHPPWIPDLGKKSRAWSWADGLQLGPLFMLNFEITSGWACYCIKMERAMTRLDVSMKE